MKKLNVWKHTVSGLLALLIVAGAVPVTNDGGGLFTDGTAITAMAAASEFTEKKLATMMV